MTVNLGFFMNSYHSQFILPHL